MNKIGLVVLISFIFVGSTRAQAVPVEMHKSFNDIVETMQTLAKFKGSSYKRNTIYISNVMDNGRGEFAYAYWKEDNSLTILNLPLILPLKKDSLEHDWLTTKARIDLRNGVVPTEEDIGGSSYLVDRPWVNKIKKLCRSGFRLIL